MTIEIPRARRQELMDAVFYGYFTLPLRPDYKASTHPDPHGAAGVATLAITEGADGRAYYGAALCAPGDVFSRHIGKFGSVAAPAMPWDPNVRIPGAHARLVGCLSGERGVLQGTCPAGGTHFETARNAIAALAVALQTRAWSKKLAWLHDVMWTQIAPRTRRRSKKGAANGAAPA